MTKNEAKVLKFIKKFIEKNDYSPSFAEIAKYMDWKSKSSSHQIIHALVYLKKIKVDPKKKRSLELV